MSWINCNKIYIFKLPNEFESVIFNFAHITNLYPRPHPVGHRIISQGTFIFLTLFCVLTKSDHRNVWRPC